MDWPPLRKSFSRICFVGDAFVVGAGDRTALGWVGRIAQHEWQSGHDITIYNLGIRGNSSRDILARWRQEVERRLPAQANGRLLFMFGGNDAKDLVGRGIEVPLAESIENARRIIGEAASLMPTLWIGLLPMSETKPYPKLLSGPAYSFSNARQAEYNAAYRHLAGELSVPFLDLHTPFLRDPRWMEYTQAGDGSNPADEGYQYLAEHICRWDAWRKWFD